MTSDNLSAADVAAVTRNDGFGGFNGDGAWWLIVLFLFIFNGNWGGFGNNGGYGGYGSEVQRGFDQSAVMNGITNIQNSLTNGFVDTAAALCNGFAGVNASINQQGFNLQSQIAQANSANQLGIADLKYTVATENCADRTALNNGVRDIINNQTAGIQRILDQMCNDKIDAKNERIAELERKLTMANLAASQGAQTAAILANNEAQTAALEQYLAPVARPAYLVQNPNGCNCNYGCGQMNNCGCGF